MWVRAFNVAFVLGLILILGCAGSPSSNLQGQLVLPNTESAVVEFPAAVYLMEDDVEIIHTYSDDTGAYSLGQYSFNANYKVFALSKSGNFGAMIPYVGHELEDNSLLEATGQISGDVEVVDLPSSDNVVVNVIGLPEVIDHQGNIQIPATQAMSVSVNDFKDYMFDNIPANTWGVRVSLSNTSESALVENVLVDETNGDAGTVSFNNGSVVIID